MAVARVEDPGGPTGPGGGPNGADDGDLGEWAAAARAVLPPDAPP